MRDLTHFQFGLFRIADYVIMINSCTPSNLSYRPIITDIVVIDYNVLNEVPPRSLVRYLMGLLPTASYLNFECFSLEFLWIL